MSTTTTMTTEARLGTIPVTKTTPCVTSHKVSLLRASTIAAVFIMLVLCVVTASADPYGSARSCLFNRHLRVDNVSRCKFGWEVDACGNKICTKGPGEVCGGKHMRYGICGEGLMCNNCNRCQVRYQKFFNFVNLTIRLLVLKIFNFNNFKAELLKKHRQ